MERTGVMTFKGNPMTLVGPALEIGQRAPDFTATDTGLAPVSLADFKGQLVIISTIPSIDTGVCELQTKRFNAEASGLKAKVLTISMDLPFAHKRFCGAQDAINLVMLSDYKDHAFSHAYGVYIKELGLIARGVFIVDAAGKLAYQEIVPEATNHPNYEAALAKARELGA